LPPKKLSVPLITSKDGKEDIQNKKMQFDVHLMARIIALIEIHFHMDYYVASPSSSKPLFAQTLQANAKFSSLS
jgi:hypothetical protein